MGGLIIIFATLVPVLLFAKLDNIYVLLLIVTTIWMGLIGFLDDYIKVFRKNKEGLKGRFKVVGQVGLGLIVGSVMYFNNAIEVRTVTSIENVVIEKVDSTPRLKLEEKSTATTIPFFNNIDFEYTQWISWTGKNYKDYELFLFLPMVIQIVMSG